MLTSVSNVPELADPVELDEVLADRGPQELGMKFGDTVDLARAWAFKAVSPTTESEGRVKPYR